MIVSSAEGIRRGAADPLSPPRRLSLLVSSRDRSGPGPLSPQTSRGTRFGRAAPCTSGTHRDGAPSRVGASRTPRQSQIGAQHLANVEALVLPLPAELRADGLLGVNVLDTFGPYLSFPSNSCAALSDPHGHRRSSIPEKNCEGFTCRERPQRKPQSMDISLRKNWACYLDTSPPITHK